MYRWAGRLRVLADCNSHGLPLLLQQQPLFVGPVSPPVLTRRAGYVQGNLLPSVLVAEEAVVDGGISQGIG